MRKRSNVLEAKRRAQVDVERRLTPEQRLEACVAHSRLVLEFYHAGVRDRGTATRTPSVKR